MDKEEIIRTSEYTIEQIKNIEKNMKSILKIFNKKDFYFPKSNSDYCEDLKNMQRILLDLGHTTLDIKRNSNAVINIENI